MIYFFSTILPQFLDNMQRVIGPLTYTSLNFFLFVAVTALVYFLFPAKKFR